MNATCQEQWINSEEYKELNFERKNLVINPAKACQPLGAFLCALGVEGALPFVHGSQGCAAYFRNNLSRHYREPISGVSDSMTEDSAVFGGQGNLVEGLQNAYAIYKPKVITMFTSCMAEVIGDDISAYIENARYQKAIPQDFPVAFAHTPSFKGSHITGYDNMLKGLIQCLAFPREESKINDRLYIVPGFDPYPSNLREVKRLLDMMGVNYTILPDYSDVVDTPNTGTFEMYQGGTPFTEVQESLNAMGYLFLQSHSTPFTYKYLEGQGVPVYSVPMPIGMAGTDGFIQKVAEITGMTIPKEIEIERGRTVDSATDAHPYIHGKRFALFGDPDVLLGMVRFLLEMGGEPIHIVCSNPTAGFEQEMKELLSSTPYGKSGVVYAGKDLWHLRSLLMTDAVDMLIGDSHGKYAAKDAGIPLVRVGFPITDRVNMHRYPIIGYQGMMNLITMISNTFIEEKDRTSSDAYFELLR